MYDHIFIIRIAKVRRKWRMRVFRQVDKAMKVCGNSHISSLYCANNYCFLASWNRKSLGICYFRNTGQIESSFPNEEY